MESESETWNYIFALRIRISIRISSLDFHTKSKFMHILMKALRDYAFSEYLFAFVLRIFWRQFDIIMFRSQVIDDHVFFIISVTFTLSRDISHTRLPPYKVE